MDIALKQTTGLDFDIAIQAPDVLVDNGLRTAIIISLFTDRQANDVDELTDGSQNKRGWWADALGAQGDKIGSRLYLLRRSKQTPGVLITAREYCIEALQWKLTDNVVRRIEVDTEWVARGVLGIRATLYKADGKPFEAFFEYSLESI
jgi:phage gp46-like protein